MPDLLTRPALEVAPRLLGAVLRAGPVAVRLTEVEAYLGEGEDEGSHAHRGPTPRTASMWRGPGTLYVYLSYGIHRCLNVVCGPAGSASAVLLRAGEIVDGLEVARLRRPSARADAELARGPVASERRWRSNSPTTAHPSMKRPSRWSSQTDRPRGSRMVREWESPVSQAPPRSPGASGSTATRRCRSTVQP